LRSYKAALRDLNCKTPHSTERYENNIAELSHQKTRLQQRQMRGPIHPGSLNQLATLSDFLHATG